LATKQLDQFIEALFEKPPEALKSGDWEILLFELQLQKS
jgi:hypothetical protein